jgi:pimeloyl-ACP methyl ester carboxylesterase
LRAFVIVGRSNISQTFIHDMAESHIYAPARPRRTSIRRIRGFDCAIHEWGDPGQPRFVYLHGFFDCAATFQLVVDALERDWHVIAPDLRGFGDSRGAAESYWFPDYLADLDALLAESWPDGPVRLVGHSMGANVAGLYAGAFPDRVGALVNLEGFGLDDSDPDDAPARYRQWIEAGREMPTLTRYADFAALAERICGRNARMDRAAAEYVARCWGREEDGEVRLAADPRHRLVNPVLYRRAEAEACWRAVTADVLLVAGGKSEFARGADERLGVASLDLPFPNASVRVIEEAGHMLHFDAPAELAAAIEAFFGKTL